MLLKGILHNDVLIEKRGRVINHLHFVAKKAVLALVEQDQIEVHSSFEFLITLSLLSLHSI